MNNIKYTFLLPAYKARFFEEALLSIKNQTYTDFKVIVSDDCSPENLKSIYDKVCADDPRFTFRRNEENMGSKSIVSHWNLLVDMCDTEFFIMASDDDVYNQKFLEEINKLTIKYPQVNLFRGKARRINECNNILFEDATHPEFLCQIDYLRYITSSLLMLCEANYCYRTQEFKLSGGYIDFPKAWFSDQATHILMSRNGNVSTKEILFTQRSSNINISSIKSSPIDSEIKIKALLLFNKWIKKYIDELYMPNSGMLKPLILSNHQKMIIEMVYGRMPDVYFFSLLKLSKESQKNLGMSRMKLFYDWICKRIKDKR